MPEPREEANPKTTDNSLPRPDQEGTAIRARVMAAWLALLGFVVFNANLRLVSSGDNLPARFLPLLLLKHKTLTLDPMRATVAHGEPSPYWIEPRGPSTHSVSHYPVTAPVLLTPLYLPALAYLEGKGWNPWEVERTARVMEKLAASLVASASMAVMFLLLTRRVRRGWAVLLTLAYGFGTTTWTIAGQGLWQHGLSECVLAGCLLVLTGPCTPGRSFGGGFLCALAVACRPSNAVLAVAMVLGGWTWARGFRTLAAAGLAIPSGLLLTYNRLWLGDLLGGYGLQTGAGYLSAYFPGSLVAGLAGLLFSPARGLFAFSPFLVFLPLTVCGRLRRGESPLLDRLLLGAVLVQLACFAPMDWRAGASWGPRWLTDTLPLLVWLMAPGVQELRTAGRALFAASVLVSVGIQTVGAFWYTGTSNQDLLREVGDPGRMEAVWNWRSAPFLRELDHPPAPRDLLVLAQGCIDRVQAQGREVEAVVAGTTLEVLGWALADGRTPDRVWVRMAPGPGTRWQSSNARGEAGADAFVDRPDVRKALGTEARSGWRIQLDTTGLAPGPYSLSLVVLPSPGGGVQLAAHRPLQVLAPGEGPGGGEGTDRSRASRRLAERQDAHGYWRTTHTKVPALEAPVPELNTFLTALMIDTLAPVAASTGLGAALDRAREHLAAQIEESGLVRYHGLPESVPPGMGCAITPDSDDTALAWRVAGPDPGPRLARAMETLAAFRTPEGLYRTWLAPREAYACLDPGKDPNPADATIQMHVLMFLDRFDPPGARALDAALRARWDADEHWVYYSKAPLVPLLRAADLRRLGYPLHLPKARRAAAGPEQELWMQVVEWLVARAAGEDVPPHAALMLRERLAADDFAFLRTHPPLLYHNDLTATVRRYYWSEDFGYALWLRLDAAAAEAQAAAGKADPR